MGNDNKQPMNKISIVKIICRCEWAPALWEAIDNNGKFYSFRYRWGVFTIKSSFQFDYLYDERNEIMDWVLEESVKSSSLSFKQLKELLRYKFIFPDKECSLSEWSSIEDVYKYESDIKVN